VVDVETALIADGQAAKTIDPGECALDDPSVLAQPLTALSAAAGDPVPDAGRGKPERLIAYGRPSEALAWLDWAPDRDESEKIRLTDLRIAALDALGRRKPSPPAAPRGLRRSAGSKAEVAGMQLAAEGHPGRSRCWPASAPRRTLFKKQFTLVAS
jgi:hypothetical protein